MDLFSNIIQIFIQLIVTRWLLVHYGPGFVFALCALIVSAACIGLMFYADPYAIIIAGMPAIALIQILTRALAHGMLQPARETLYTLVSRDLRYKGKNAVDTVVWRLGDVVSLLSIKWFRSLGVTVAGFGLIWALLAAASGWIGWRLSKQAENREFEN